MRKSPVVPSRTLVPGLLALAALAAGCDQPTEALRSATPAGAALAANGAAPEVLPGETEMWQFAREVPGFAGVHMDVDGSVVVQITDVAHSSRARGAVTSILPHMRGVGVKVRPAQHTFAQLAAWRDAAEVMLDEIGGARSLDLDEVRNIVVIEATDPQSRGQIMREAHRRGIPANGMLVIASEDEGEASVEMWKDEPYPSVAPSGSNVLGGAFTTLVGGIAAGRRGTSGRRNCNVGFIAELSGVRTFITASSCSLTPWKWDGETWYQPGPLSSTEQFRVGAEYRDKRGESCGFMSPNVCRYSDATAIALDAGIAASRGHIARTVDSMATVPSSKAIDPANPHFTITSTLNPIVGQKAHKVGSATGWTYGQVIRSCAVLFATQRTWSKLRCQSSVNAGAENGDSGAPVFFRNPDGTVRLMGILWGARLGLHYINGYHVVSYDMSPFSGIQTDLGTMTVTVPSTTTDPGTGGGGGGGGCSGCEQQT